MSRNSNTPVRDTHESLWEARQANPKGIAMLAGAILTTGVLWLIVFPWICTYPNVAQHIETQKRIGINPSAKFYSELDVAPAVSLRAERLNQTYSAEFWGQSRADDSR